MRRPAILFAAMAVAVAAAASACGSEGPQEPRRPASRPPPAGGYFSLSPTGAALPDERRCAALVQRSAWEPRPRNSRANHRVPRRVRLTRIESFDPEWNQRYRSRVTGAFVGTTDEIIQWAACKWGLSDELLRAQAVAESYWKQSQRGDFEPRSEGVCTVHDRRDPCPTSFGLLQVKWYYSRPAYPYTRVMTPFQVDWSAAQMRGCYDGRKFYPAGDFWACIGNWWSGGWNDPGARAYIGRVRTAFERKEWLTWADRGASVPYDTGLRQPPLRGQSPLAAARRSSATHFSASRAGT